MTKFFVFSAKNKRNIEIGHEQSRWAVSNVTEATLSARFSRAKNYLEIGDWGIFYCSENKSFTTPFKIQSLPINEYVEGVWPERWALPFEIRSFSTPEYWLGLGMAKKIWSRHKSYIIPTNEIHGITGLTVFNANYVNTEDWNFSIEKLGVPISSGE